MKTREKRRKNRNNRYINQSKQRSEVFARKIHVKKEQSVRKIRKKEIKTRPYTPVCLFQRINPRRAVFAAMHLTFSERICLQQLMCCHGPGRCGSMESSNPRDRYVTGSWSHLQIICVLWTKIDRMCRWCAVRACQILDHECDGRV